ncbi:MAG: PDZ domain-containing protein [Sedimentisphaerales bacterium]
MRKIRFEISVDKVLRISIWIILCLTLGGCLNPYAQFYKDLTGGKDITQEPRMILSSSEPKLVQGTNADADVKKMLENSYVLIGYSSFNSGNVNQQSALEQAKKIHAEIVIVYSRYTHTLQGVMPITTPDTRAYSSYNSGTIYGSNGGFANYSGSTYGTSYGTQTTYMPYAIARYDYSASFWVKMRPMLGIFFDDLTDELRKKIESNKGVYIKVVVKDSPAFIADLLPDDIIQRFNNIEIKNKEHFHQMLESEKGHEIELQIYRNNQTLTKRIRLQE